MRLIDSEAWLYTCAMNLGTQRSYERRYCEAIVARICKSSHNFYVFGVYRNPNQLDKNFGRLLAAMAKVQPINRKAYSLFVGDVNAHHEEFLGSSATTLHGRIARDFTSSSSREQMFTWPTHFDAEVLNLVLTEVLYLAGVQMDPFIRTSDHSAFYRCCAEATYSSLGV